MTGLQISMLFLVTMVTLFVFFSIYIIIRLAVGARLDLQKRLNRVVFEKQDLLGDVKKNRKINNVSGANKKKYKIYDVILEELQNAYIMMKPEEFVAIWILLAIGPSSLVALFTSQFPFAVMLALIGVIAPIFFVSEKKKKRTLAFENQLGDALVIICNCLRSGLTFQQAMTNIADEMPEPIGVEFERAVREMRYGVSMEDALQNMTLRVNSQDLMLAVSSVNIQRQTGGNLSQILTVISETIKERVKIKAEIRTATSQGRMSGYIIGALPVAVAAILLLVNKEYMMTFVTEPTGRIMLIIAVAMELMGFAVIRKVVDIKY